MSSEGNSALLSDSAQLQARSFQELQVTYVRRKIRRRPPNAVPWDNLFLWGTEAEVPAAASRLPCDDSSSGQTSLFDLYEKDGHVMEPIVHPAATFGVPLELLRLPELSGVLNMKTFTSLSESEKTYLFSFLPHFRGPDALTEREKTLQMLFRGESFFFGSPMVSFFSDLKNGVYHPSVQSERQRMIALLRSRHQYRTRQYHNRMISAMMMKAAAEAEPQMAAEDSDTEVEEKPSHSRGGRSGKKKAE